MDTMKLAVRALDWAASSRRIWRHHISVQPEWRRSPIWIVGRLSSRMTLSGLEFVYPRCCTLCHGSIEAEDPARASGPSFCPSCRAALLPKNPNACRRCGSPLGPYVDPERGCIVCRKRRFVFTRVIRLGLYTDRLRQACIRSKERGGEAQAASLAHLLWETQKDSFEECEPDMVLPVPQYWCQRVTRPHNSAETIAHVLSRCLKVEFHRNILSKTRLTPDQSSLTSERRRTNLRKAFRVRRKPLVNGRTVLLVDDILTTGTTANECSRAIRSAGARRVVVAVAAVVPKEGA